MSNGGGVLSGERVAMVLTNDAVSDPRVDKEARTLAGAGAEVIVVAWDRSKSLPVDVDRVAYKVRRCGPPARHGAGFGNIGAYRRFWDDAVREVVALQPTIVHCHDSDTAPVGVRVLKALGRDRCSLVLDLHELYRESRMIPRAGAKGAAAKFAVWWAERAAATRAAAIIVANPGQAATVAGIAADDPRLTIVENAPDLERFNPSGRIRAKDGVLTVCFVGQKRTAEPLVDLMDAVGRVSGTRALIAGGGPAEKEVEQTGRMREQVDVLGRVNYEEIPALYDQCDAVYAVYDASVGNYRTHFPVKAMEAMAVGIPVLVTRGTWVADYVERHRIGAAVPEGEINAIARVLERWRDDPDACREMGARGRELVESGLNWSASAQRLIGAYRSILDSRKESMIS